MAKYYINLETLEIERKKFNLVEFLLKHLPYIFAIFSFSIILTLFLITHFPTPREMKLMMQKQQYLHKFSQINQRLLSLQQDLKQLAEKDANLYRNIFGLSTVHTQWINSGIGGAVKQNELVANDKIVGVNKNLIKLLSKQIEIQSNSYREVIEVVRNKELMASSIPAIQPISNKDLIRFGSPFGYRLHPILHVVRMHTGIDLTARIGTPVYATGDGIVIRADASARGYGKHVRIAHGFGYVTLYAHLSKILVRPGQRVRRGDLIGLVGNTGLSTAPHLHYEVRINGKPVNPINFYYNDMTDEEYQLMIKQAATANTHIFE